MRKTSKQAFKSLPDQKTTYGKIIKALQKMPNGGHFEAIAKRAGLPPDKVWRRLNDLVDRKILVNSGTKPTSTGRMAMVRKLAA